MIYLVHACSATTYNLAMSRGVVWHWKSLCASHCTQTILLRVAPKNVAYRNETIHFVCACEIEISASMWVGLNAGKGSEEICVQLLASLVGWFVASHTLPAATGWRGSKLQALLPLTLCHS